MKQMKDAEVRDLLAGLTAIPSLRADDALMDALADVVIDDGVTANDIRKLQWCGIFATLVLNRLFPDLHVRWKLGFGMKASRPRSYPSSHDPVQVGDVLVGPKPNYHYQVITHVEHESSGDDTEQPPGQVTLVEGNTPGVRFNAVSLKTALSRYRYRFY